MDDLHHHLAGRHRLDDGGADSLLAHLLGEGTHHFERDVGLQQRAAHLAHRGIDIGLGQRAAARQPIENATKLFRQIVEHGPINLSSPRPGGERGRIAPPASLRSRRQLSSAIRVRGHPDREVENPSPQPSPYGRGGAPCLPIFGDTKPFQNTFAPEGASRCRALTSGLTGPGGGSKRTVFPRKSADLSRDRPESQENRPTNCRRHRRLSRNVPPIPI